MRIHNNKRLTLFTLEKMRDIPVAIDRLAGARYSNVTITSSGQKIVHSDDWRTSSVPNAVIGHVFNDVSPTEKWIGTTLFALRPPVKRPNKKEAHEDRGRAIAADDEILLGHWTTHFPKDSRCPA